MHNEVRARLTEEDDTIEPKPQWPSPKECPTCYAPTAEEAAALAAHHEAAQKAFDDAKRAKKKPPTPPPAPEVKPPASPLLAWDDGAWQKDYVFSFLQVLHAAGIEKKKKHKYQRGAGVG